MTSCDIVVIGAGACGLTASRELLRKGFKVTILEARSRAGGRICTITDHEFPVPIEGGAEFIHGPLPLTLGLLREYGINPTALEGVFWQTKTNDVDKKDNFIEEHERLLSRHLKEVTHDMSVDRFLELNFADEQYHDLKQSVRGFVSGYDAADTSRASVFAFRDEWLAEGDDDQQFRIQEGYSKLTEALADDCLKLGCTLQFSSVVKTVDWEKGVAVITTESGDQYSCNKLLVTVPVGTLTGEDKIRFNPPLKRKETALNKLGYGGVIKISILFNSAFWKNNEIRRTSNHDLDKLGFIFSDATIPTWWTQYPTDAALLTGWIGGKGAAELSAKGESEILESAVNSLAAIFILTPSEIEAMVLTTRIFDWIKDPYSCGAYTFEVVRGQDLKAVMREPEFDTIYFAGEGYHIGENPGTVDAALSEGFRVARDIHT